MKQKKQKKRLSRKVLKTRVSVPTNWMLPATVLIYKNKLFLSNMVLGAINCLSCLSAHDTNKTFDSEGDLIAVSNQIADKHIPQNGTLLVVFLFHVLLQMAGQLGARRNSTRGRARIRQDQLSRLTFEIPSRLCFVLVLISRECVYFRVVFVNKLHQALAVLDQFAQILLDRF